MLSIESGSRVELLPLNKALLVQSYYTAFSPWMLVFTYLSLFLGSGHIRMNSDESGSCAQLLKIGCIGLQKRKPVQI